MATRACTVGVISAALALLIVSGAGAAVVPWYTASPDWSGYVAGEKGIRMDQVSAGWTVPSASCTTVATAFSAVSAWVGLGDSTRIEQIGTGTSCDTDKHGAAFASAWWELYPSPSHVVDHPVAAGDRAQASISVTGHVGTISDSAWAATKFGLIIGKPRRLLAWPSPLHAGGRAFTVLRTDRSPPPEPPPPPV